MGLKVEAQGESWRDRVEPVATGFAVVLRSCDRPLWEWVSAFSIPSMSALTYRARRLWFRATNAPRARKLVMRVSPSARRHAQVGPPQAWKAKRDFQIAFLKQRGLLPEHRLLDFGCGTLRGGIPLIAYLEPGNYVGLDAREEVLPEAREELRAAGMEERRPLLLVSEHPDEAPFPAGMRFDRIWAFSVLIHLSDDILERALRMIAERLTPDGEFYANVNIGQRPELTWERFPVVTRPLSFYRGAAARHGLSVDTVGTLATLGERSGAGGEQVMLCFTRASEVAVSAGAGGADAGASD
ncbi:class I SAM-dependent methyltransferase [Svornostia abyssi]